MNPSAFINPRVYARSGDYAGSAAFGDDANDIVIFDDLVTIAAAGLVADTDGYITIDLTSLPVLRPDTIYGFEVTTKTAALGPAVSAMGSAAAASVDDPQWQKGYYTQGGPPQTWNAWSAAGRLAFRLEKLGYDTGVAPGSAIAPAVISPDRALKKSATFSMAIPATRISRPSGDVQIPAATVTFDEPASVNRSGTLNLAQLPSAGIVPVLPTKDQFLSSITLTRTSDSVVLAQGTDYVAYLDQGAVGLPSAGSAVPVSYVATARAQRYDIVSVNPKTKAVVVTKGTDRFTRDPEYYRPVLPAGNIELYVAYVTWHGVDLIPVMHHRNYVRDDRKAEVAIRQSYNRSCLPNTLKALRTGSALKIIPYGDSITAIGGGAFTANGSTRDLASWLSDMPADTKALFPTYDGPAGVGAHIRIGWAWVLKAALERRYGSALSVLNYGWGGTTSGNNNPDASHYGGLWPDRIAPVLAEGPGLMLLAFGMNELGDANTYANIVSIIGQAKAVGQEVIVITPPRCNEIGRGTVYDAWRKTHDDLVLAALDTGSAYVSTFELDGKGFEGAVARSPQSMCTMNLYNHPWPYELADIGNLIASIFD